MDVIMCPPDKKTADFRRFLVELAGLEPATSWVRSKRSRANLTQRLTHAALMHCSVPQNGLVSEADARTRTGDPFITSELRRSGGVCRRVAGSGLRSGIASRSGTHTALCSIASYRGVWARIGHASV